MALTESLDLHCGTTLWEDASWDYPLPSRFASQLFDVAIVGAGITGSILAERLTADGLSVAVFDRRPPASGSTAASTAQLMWAMDVPMCELARQIGEAEAARRWRRVHESLQRFGQRIDDLGLDAGKFDCPTVYLSGNTLDAEALRLECRLHQAHGLPSRYLEAAEVHSAFAIAPRPAIVSAGGFAVDPVKLSHGLLRTAMTRGAQVAYPVDVTSLREHQDHVVLTIEGGESARARHVIIAGGYERATLLLPPPFRLHSTFVIATAEGMAPRWPERSMIWEASDPYIYVRSDCAGRIIAGGEDERLCDTARRDELLGPKSGVLAAKLAALLGLPEIGFEYAWSATFGGSPDGLPGIGKAAFYDKVWLAAGFGGNGIAFSALAAEVLAAAIKGEPDTDAGCFDPYRFSG